MIIFLAHIVACVWHFTGILVYEATGRSWLSESGLLTADLSQRYFSSLYWAVYTMITVGYGDIYGVTMAERVVNIFIMLLGCGVFGYSTNSIGILLQNINAGVSSKRQKYYMINKFMKRKNLSKDTQTRVNHYLDYIFESQNEGKAEEDAIVAMLSEGIQAQIMKEVNGRVLKENRLFQSLFGTNFLSLISHYLEEKIYAPGEILFDESVREYSAYFISSGIISLSYGDGRYTIYKLDKGMHFGEFSFFSGHASQFGAKSDTFTSLFLLRKEHFLERVVDFPAELETFHMVKDKLNLYDDYSAVQTKCFSCGHIDHTIVTCPILHFVPDRKRVIDEHIRDCAEERQSFKRRDRVKYHTLLQLEETQYKTRIFKHNTAANKRGMIPKKNSQTIIQLPDSSRVHTENDQNESMEREKTPQTTPLTFEDEPDVSHHVFTAGGRIMAGTTYESIAEPIAPLSGRSAAPKSRLDLNQAMMPIYNR